MAACISPINLKRENIIHPENYHSYVVPCGRCPSCLNRRAAHWYFRLLHQKKESDTCSFVTWTYDDENLPEALMKSELQNLFKKMRKDMNFKYYAVGEYGDQSLRPHFHAIMYDLPERMIYADNLETKGVLRSTSMEWYWKKGFVDVREPETGRFRYICGYLDKRKDNMPVREFNLMSKGLGKSWLTDANLDYYNRNPKPYIIGPGGEKIAMPRYYKEKLYTDENRARISKQVAIFAERKAPKVEKDFRMEVEIKKDIIQKAARKNRERKRSN